MPDEPSEWRGAAQGVVKVLVVDDCPDSLDAIAKAARSNGWQVDVADSAELALQRVRLALGQGAAFDAVFFDERMPETDGWQLFETLQTTISGAQIPRCILMSSKGLELVEPQHAGPSAALDGYLVKPLTAGMLERAWVQALRKDAGVLVPTASQSGARLEGMRILVVEDNPINQQVARELLLAEGAQVQLADNGQLGVDALIKAPEGFDVVLMDMQMPVLDGLEASRKIRTELGLRTLPVIAMTANAMTSDREACLEAGMNDHVGKPFDLNLLVQVLCKYTAWTVRPPAVLPEHLPTTCGDAGGEKPWQTHVDLEGAIGRMGGFQDLYCDTLSAYLAEARDVTLQVRSALEAKEREAARRVLHSFKGLSATVGVAELADLAATLEAKLKTGHPDAAVVNEELRGLDVAIERLLPVLQALVAFLGGMPLAEKHETDSLSADQRDLLLQLLALARAQDMHALTVHACLMQGASAGVQLLLEPVSSAIAALDFAEAEAECQVLIDRLQKEQ